MIPIEAVMHITSCCSHHCPFCYYLDDTVNSYSQTYSVLKNIIDELVKFGCKRILFVGGDPAEHPDIINLGKYAKSLDINTSILSNTLNFRTISSWTEVINAFDDIEVTIHRASQQEHNLFCGKEKAFETVVANMKEIDRLSQKKFI